MDLEEDTAASFVTMRTAPGRSRNSPECSPSPIRDDNTALTTQDNTNDKKAPQSHERPITMMSPDAKRSKQEEAAKSPIKAPPILFYPKTVRVPSTKTIRTLYKAAVVDIPESFTSPSSASIDSSSKNDQMYLKVAGVLSFEQVLLPALGLEEERAIKRIQAKVQRDAPEYKFVMEQCRRLVRKSVANAITAVAANRESRGQQQAKRRQIHATEILQARESRKQELIATHKQQVQEQKRLREVARLEKRRQIQQQLPKNQKLWKEVVFLTSSISQLEKEERLWAQAEKDLKILEGSSGRVENDKENSSPIVLTIDKHSLHKEADRKAKDIVMASDRIQKGLGMVLQLLKDSEDVRSELYNKYRKDHLFEGYQQIDDPKGVIRFLSQNSHDQSFF